MTAAETLAGIGIQLEPQRAHVARALEFIAANFSQPITTNMIASNAGCTERVLQDRFHADLRRILQVNEVAVAVGMPDAGRFAVRFRE